MVYKFDGASLGGWQLKKLINLREYERERLT